MYKVLQHEWVRKAGAHLYPAADFNFTVSGVIIGGPGLIQFSLCQIVIEQQALVPCIPFTFLPARLTRFGLILVQGKGLGLRLVKFTHHAVASEHMVGPLVGIPVGGVEVLPDHHILVARGYFLAALSQVIIDLNIPLREFTGFFRGGSPEVHSPVVMKCPDYGNIGSCHHICSDGLDAGPGKGIVPCTALHIIGLPVHPPVPVGIHITFGILVEGPVSVIVDPFPSQHDPFSFFTWFDPDHKPGIIRVGAVISVRIFFPHITNVPVPVQVVVRIFIEQPVTVVVLWPPEAPVGTGGIRILEKVVTAVHVDRRKDIEAVPVHQGGDLFILPVLGQEHVGQVQANFTGLDFIAMNIAVHVHPRFGQMCSRRGIVDRYGIDGPVLLTVTDQVQGGQLRVRLVKGLQCFHHLVVIIVMVESERYFNLLS